MLLRVDMSDKFTAGLNIKMMLNCVIVRLCNIFFIIIFNHYNSILSSSNVWKQNLLN